MTTLDDLLGLPSISEMQSGGGGIPLSPIYIYRKDTLRTKLIAQPEFRLQLFKTPIILTSLDSASTEIMGFAEFSEKSGLPTSAILAVNGLAALALINSPETDISGFRKYVFETSRSTYKTEEVLREQKVFISLFNQVHFIAILNNDINVKVSDTFKNKFLSVQRLLSKIDFGSSDNTGVNKLTKGMAAMQIGGAFPTESVAAGVPIAVSVPPPPPPAANNGAKNAEAETKLLEDAIVQNQNTRFQTLMSLLDSNPDVKIIISGSITSVPSYKLGGKSVINIKHKNKFYKLAGTNYIETSSIIDNIVARVQEFVDKYPERVVFGPVGFYNNFSAQQKRVRTAFAESSNLDPSCKVIHIWFGDAADTNKSDSEPINKPLVFKTDKGQTAGIFGIAISANNFNELTKSFTQTHSCPPSDSSSAADSTIPVQGSITGLSDVEATTKPIQAKKPSVAAKPVAPPAPVTPPVTPTVTPTKPAGPVAPTPTPVTLAKPAVPVAPVPAIQQKITEKPAPPTVTIRISNSPLENFKILLVILQDYFELPQERRKEINALFKIIQDGPRSVYLYMYNGLRAEQGLAPAVTTPAEPEVEAKLLDTQVPAAAAAAIVTREAEAATTGPQPSNIQTLNRKTKLARKKSLEAMLLEMKLLLCGDITTSNVGCGRLEPFVTAIGKINTPTLFKTKYNQLLETFDAADELMEKANTNYALLTTDMQNKQIVDKVKKEIDSNYTKIKGFKDNVNALPLAEAGKLAERIRAERLSSHGIANPSIYCYANSTVQALYSIPEVRQAVLNYDCSSLDQIKGSVDEQLYVEDYQKVICLLQKAFIELSKNTALFSDATKKDNGVINFSIQDFTNVYWDFKKLTDEKGRQADASAFVESMIDDILKEKKIVDVEKLFQYTENTKIVCTNNPGKEKDLREVKYTLFTPESLHITCTDYQECYTKSINSGQGIISEALKEEIEDCGSESTNKGPAEQQKFYNFGSKYLFIKPQYKWNNGVFEPSPLTVNSTLQIRKDPNETVMNNYSIYGLIYWSGQLKPGSSSGHYYYIRFDDTAAGNKAITEIPSVVYNDSKVTFSPSVTPEQLKNAVALIYKNTSITESIPVLPVQSADLQMKTTPADAAAVSGPAKPSDVIKTAEQVSSTVTSNSRSVAKKLNDIRNTHVHNSASPKSWESIRKTLKSLRNRFVLASSRSTKTNTTRKTSWFARKGLSPEEQMRGRLVQAKLATENAKTAYENAIQSFEKAKAEYTTKRREIRFDNVTEVAVKEIDVAPINTRLIQAKIFLDMLKPGTSQPSDVLTDIDTLVGELNKDANSLKSITGQVNVNKQLYNDAVQKVLKQLSGLAITPSSAINLAAAQTGVAQRPIASTGTSELLGQNIGAGTGLSIPARTLTVLPPAITATRRGPGVRGTAPIAAAPLPPAVPAAVPQVPEITKELVNQLVKEKTEQVKTSLRAQARKHFEKLKENYNHYLRFYTLIDKLHENTKKLKIYTENINELNDFKTKRTNLPFLRDWKKYRNLNQYSFERELVGRSDDELLKIVENLKKLNKKLEEINRIINDIMTAELDTLEAEEAAPIGGSRKTLRRTRAFLKPLSKTRRNLRKK